jgi:aminobenzoyl-glutamate utilization protein B
VQFQAIDELIEFHSDHYAAISDEIWRFAELGYQERNSARIHIENLKQAGFTVREGVAGIPTAFVAEAGSGGPIIGILGEFDALSGLSQSSMALTCTTSTEISNGNGHGCGHHLLGTGAHLAAVTVKRMLEEQGLRGTIRFYGCPAEEGGWGKSFMARAGLFDDLDAALTWHPWTTNLMWNVETLAVKQVYFQFSGIAAHAGNSPHLGRSALDAVELTNVGANYLREHIIPAARLHYAVTNSGGVAPNVVQPKAEVLYMIRAPRNSDVDDVYERVCNVARGAALMTSCELTIKVHSACSNLVFNDVLNQLMQKNLERFGKPQYNADEFGFAESMYGTVRAEEIEMAGRMLQSAIKNPKPLFDGVIPLATGPRGQLHGSTDVGDVSWITPTAQCFTACFTFGTSPHSWQWVAQGKSSIAHKGMLIAAKTIAATALDLFTDRDLLEQAKAELDRQRGGNPYLCPIPEGVDPPISALAM